ncbi:MAG TPA: hypothetical protein VEQ35_03885 [Beijerinckia sp.]|nr:hypothetical protein [Beijerinckia sp.]
MRNFLAVFIGLILLCAGAQAEPKATQFWNLTSATVTELRLAPAGSGQFGENLCLHDKDKSVDHDERLKITGLNSGRYDAKIAYANGRSCLVKDLAIEAGKVFSIEDKDLTACTISSHGDD